MKAWQQTCTMFRWWRNVGVDRADLAVKRPCSSMVWHHDLATEALYLPWMKAENVRQTEIYIRPARRHQWPLVFLDDVPVSQALAVARKYDALVVETSPAGGCHVWLACSRALDENERYRAQKWLANRVGSDLGSISGEHLGRLAGFKNWKRGGVWVNVLAASCRGRRWLTVFDETNEHPSVQPHSATPPRLQSATGRDSSESGVEWGWACGMLEAGLDLRTVSNKLAERATDRRGKDVDRYVRVTCAKAAQRVSATNKGGL